MVMPLNLVSDKSPFRSLLMITLVVMIGLVVGPLLGGAIASNFYNGEFITDLQNFTLRPDAFDAILILQGTGTLVGLILFPIIYITQLEHKSLRPFFPVQDNLPMILLVVALLGIVFPIALSPIMVWNMNFKFPEFLHGFEQWAIEKEELGTRLTEQMTNFTSLNKMLAGVFVIGLVAGHRRRVGIQRTSPARDLAGKSENPPCNLVVGGYLQHYSLSIFWFYSSPPSGGTLRISLLLVRQPLDPDIFSFC